MVCAVNEIGCLEVEKGARHTSDTARPPNAVIGCCVLAFLQRELSCNSEPWHPERRSAMLLLERTRRVRIVFFV
ncbi:hypothetical protein MTO96_013452 [Rhipicephalus appendiculatus]